MLLTVIISGSMLIGEMKQVVGLLITSMQARYTIILINYLFYYFVINIINNILRKCIKKVSNAISTTNIIKSVKFGFKNKFAQ